MHLSRRSLEVRGLQLTLLVTLLPYLPFLSQYVAYAVAVGTVALISLLLVARPGSAGLAARIIKKSPHLPVLIIFLLGSQCLISISGGLSTWGAAKTIAYAAVLLLAYLILAPKAIELEARIWPLVANLGGLLSLVGVAASALDVPALSRLVNRSEWLIPTLGVRQTSSLLEDSNYFGVVALIGLLASIYALKARRKADISYLKALCLIALNGVGVLVSYSRSAYIATGIAVLVWFLVGAKRNSKTLLLLATGIALAGAFLLLGDQPAVRAFVQAEKGMSGRRYLFGAALKALAERPLLGWGVGNVDQAIQRHLGWPQDGGSFAGYLFRQGIARKWASAHNGFLDYFIMTGIPGGLIYLWLVLVGTARLRFASYRNLHRRFLLSATAGLLVATQFTTHTVGGISFGSFILTLLLGMANCWSTVHRHDDRRGSGSRLGGASW